MKKHTNHHEPHAHPHAEKKPAEPVAEEAVVDAGEPAAPTPAVPPPEEKKEPLETQLLRLQADFDNYRKRMRREKDEMYQMANEDIMKELIPVLDHYEMGLAAAEKQAADSAVVGGLKLVYEQLVRAMEKFGMKTLQAEGQPFNPHQHEAILHMASETVPADSVIQQTRKGYELKSKLLRAAQVIVSSGPAAAATEAKAEATAEQE